MAEFWPLKTNGACKENPGIDTSEGCVRNANGLHFYWREEGFHKFCISSRGFVDGDGIRLYNSVGFMRL